MIEEKKSELLTPGFVILWLGQLVSTLGDAAYSVALGFWVLAVTGSTALMGTLMAASTLPGVLVSPFAGVLIDRSKVKPLIVAMDFIRGAGIVLVAVAAYAGIIQIWMVFAVGVLLSTCGALFRPGVNTAVPELVDKSKLTNANAMLSIVANGANMAGNVSGGFLFQFLGAPFLFLFNGLSYFFSGISILFVKIPHKPRKTKLTFFEDMKAGFAYMWSHKGLKYSLLIGAVINFFSFIGIVLLLPMFEQTESLGSGKYGVAMACFMGGAMAGYILTSTISIPPRYRSRIFSTALALSNILIILGIYQGNFALMTVFIIAAGFANAIVNVLLMSCVQGFVEISMRGKVMAFMSMITQGLTPFAMALGGVLGGIFPVKLVIVASFAAAFVVGFPFFFLRDFNSFLNTDYAKAYEEAVVE